VPDGYADGLHDLKNRIHSAQQRAALAVNRELVLLYWQIGRDILARQAEQGWGAKVFERLAHDLRTAFPEMKGFSPRNLQYMRAFAEAWPEAALVQQAVAPIPWGHNQVLLDRLNTEAERRWCALADKTQPMGIAVYKLLESLPAELQASLPSIEQIERELGNLAE
jgi:predicted nuclease of restriction endonuclease-like (RecB) superfamily